MAPKMAPTGEVSVRGRFAVDGVTPLPEGSGSVSSHRRYGGLLLPPILDFPVTDAVVGALARYPLLSGRLPLQPGERRPQYIVALLDNTHHAHNLAAVDFIEKALPWAGSIGASLLQAPVHHQFLRTLDELVLLGHLRKGFGDRATPPQRTGGTIPDILVEAQGTLAALELYSPTDCMATELFDSYLLPAFRYADVPRGFLVRLDLDTVRKDGESSLWTVQLPRGETTILEWMARLVGDVKGWLAEARPGDTREFPEPSGVLMLKAEFVEAYDDPGNRSVSKVDPTKSTDSRILFEYTPEVVADNPWGRKLADKMRKRQAGEAPGERLRVLVVNFSLMDAGEPEFISWKGYAETVRDAFLYIALSCGEPPVYDLVVPAVRLFTPVFGMAAVLPHVDAARATGFLRAAGMEFTSQQRPW